MYKKILLPTDGSEHSLREVEKFYYQLMDLNTLYVKLKELNMYWRKMGKF